MSARTTKVYLKSIQPLSKHLPRQAYHPKGDLNSNRVQLWVSTFSCRLEGKCKQNVVGGELAWWDVEGVWWPQDPVIKCVSANQCPPLPRPIKGKIVCLHTKAETN